MYCTCTCDQGRGGVGEGERKKLTQTVGGGCGREGGEKERGKRKEGGREEKIKWYRQREEDANFEE